MRNKKESSWISKDLFTIDKKDKAKLNFNKKKISYKLEPVPRTEIYEPIRHNSYYIHLKNSGLQKDDILCGVHESAIKINKVLFDCFTAADLKSDERQMFLWVLSNTTGYNRREVSIEVKKIADEIGRSRSFVSKALNRLSERKMIFITKKEEDLSIYLNTMPNTWISTGDRVQEILGKEEFE
jgi:phage replication O-like protein O